MVPSSSAIVDRKQGKVAYPTSATSLSQTGTRSCRISIGSDGFCDSSSVRLVFTINNLDTAKDMKFWAGPWAAWGTVRLLSQGTELERLDLYGRHHELFGFQLLPFQDQWTEAAVCGLHGSWDTIGGNMDQLQPKVGKIEKGERAIVMHKLHLSLFNSHKILPLRFCPLELELQLAPSAYWLDVITVSSGTTLTYSNNYSLSDIRVIYDEVVPDESIVQSFYKGLLANQIMSVPVLRAHQFMTRIDSGSTSVDVTAARAFSKISSIWVTFSSNDILNADLVMPSTHVNGLGMEPYIDSGAPAWAPSVRLSIGGKNFPDPSPSDSIPMQYYNLIKTLGYSPNITRDDFINDTYALVFDMKRVPFDHGSGISSRSGDLIRIEIKNITANKAKFVHVTMFAYSVVAIRENGISVLD